MDWNGTSRFQILRTKLPEVYTWVHGRPTNSKHTPRTATFWTEEWPRLSKKKKKKQEEIAAWDEEETRLQEARRKREIFRILSEAEEYLKVISDARAKLEKCMVPSMPCTPKQECLGNRMLCRYSKTLGNLKL